MSYDPIPANGAGAERFDQPSLFYLTNRELIEEWAALKENVAEAVDEWYRHTLRDALSTKATERGLEVSEARGPTNYRHVVLHPPDTPIVGSKPVVGVGLGWHAKRVNPSGLSAFVCVRCSRNDAGRNAAQALLDAGGRSYRGATPAAKGADTDAWPIWWWAPATDQWWTDLDAYRTKLVDDVLRMTDALREPLDAAAAVEVMGTEEENE